MSNFKKAINAIKGFPIDEEDLSLMIIVRLFSLILLGYQK